MPDLLIIYQFVKVHKVFGNMLWLTGHTLRAEVDDWRKKQALSMLDLRGALV